MTKDQAAKKKAEWLRGCLESGWGKESLDDLSTVWDRFKDEYGNLRPRPESTTTLLVEGIEDLQNQVRKHIKDDDLFDWHEALTEEEMGLLENLLLTFNPLCPPGSIGFEEQKKHIAAHHQQGGKEDEFLEFVRNERNQFSLSTAASQWWYEDVARRVVIENLLIAYDQMVERLSSLFTATGGWVKVEDQLPGISSPKNLNKVQVYCDPLGITDAFYWGIENVKETDPCKGWSIMGVTHWMPLPEPPTS